MYVTVFFYLSNGSNLPYPYTGPHFPLKQHLGRSYQQLFSLVAHHKPGYNESRSASCREPLSSFPFLSGVSASDLWSGYQQIHTHIFHTSSIDFSKGVQNPTKSEWLFQTVHTSSQSCLPHKARQPFPASTFPPLNTHSLEARGKLVCKPQDWNAGTWSCAV